MLCYEMEKCPKNNKYDLEHNFGNDALGVIVSSTCELWAVGQRPYHEPISVLAKWANDE